MYKRNEDSCSHNFDLLAAGEDDQGIKKAYPNITDEDIKGNLVIATPEGMRIRKV